MIVEICGFRTPVGRFPCSNHGRLPKGSVLLQANCTQSSSSSSPDSAWSYENFQIFQHEMLPSFQLVRRLLQTKGPSGSRLNSSTVPIRFWVLNTVQRLMLLRNPSQGNLWYRNSWVSTLNALCIFQGLRLCRFWMVQASWASLQVETRNLFCTWNKLKSPDRKSSLAICHVESEAAWSKDPHKAEQTLQWKHQKNNDENDFESNLNTLREKDEAGPKLARHHLETCKGSAYIARLRYWIFALGFWQHPAKHCHITKCSSHPRTPTLLRRIIPHETRKSALQLSLSS